MVYLSWPLRMLIRLGLVCLLVDNHPFLTMGVVSIWMVEIWALYVTTNLPSRQTSTT